MARRNPSVAWNVYLRGKLIDTVFYTSDYTAEEVRRSLVNHDGYDPAIKVRRQKGSRKSNPHGTARDIPARWTPATVKRLRGGKVQIRIGRRG